MPVLKAGEEGESKRKLGFLAGSLECQATGRGRGGARGRQAGGGTGGVRALGHSTTGGIYSQLERKLMEGWQNGDDFNEFMFPKIALAASWGISCRETLSRRRGLGATSVAPTRTRRGSLDSQLSGLQRLSSELCQKLCRFQSIAKPVLQEPQAGGSRVYAWGLCLLFLFSRDAPRSQL